ncbi:hypothetical protein HYU13_03745, partial [Candidatus Woesearchaeota archaeon]|nr:hypothetical protein [Candidatus Woesearchaeota archaeon]
MPHKKIAPKEKFSLKEAKMPNLPAKEKLALFLIELVILMPFAFVDAITIQDGSLKVEGLTTSSASIAWDTDVIGDSLIEFGKGKSLGQQ